MVSSSGISWTIYKSAPWPRHNHASIPPLSFLQAGCPSCCPTNSVKALKAIVHITRYVKLPNSNENAMLHFIDVLFCLHKLCHIHTKKNVFLKFLDKKRDGTAKQTCSKYRRKKVCQFCWPPTMTTVLRLCGFCQDYPGELVSEG